MKAKHIRKLRKVVANMSVYTVSETSGLFGGDFRGDYSCYETKIIAIIPHHALIRFSQRYRREYKRLPSHFIYSDETTIDWGRFKVVDKKGFEHYF